MKAFIRNILDKLGFASPSDVAQLSGPSVKENVRFEQPKQKNPSVILEPDGIINLSVEAIKKMKQFLASSNEDYSIRLEVVSEGIGVKHRMTIEDKIAPADYVNQAYGFRIVVDPASLEIVRGIHIDWKTEDGQEGFKINNPNVTEVQL